MKETLILVPEKNDLFFVKTENGKTLWIEQLFLSGPTIWSASEKLAKPYSLEQIKKRYPENPLIIEE